MLKEQFSVGPFTVRPSGRACNAQLVDVIYGSEVMRERVPVDPGTRGQVVDQLGRAPSDITKELRREHENTGVVSLVDGYGEALAGFDIEGYALPDMTPGIVDDRCAYWLRTSDRLYSQAVTLNEYARIRAEHERPALAWIADLLNDDLLTLSKAEWRPPTAWELRHVIGVGSFTDITGLAAANLVGVNASSFRKYTAKEGARTRQEMSFAMWHLLLHRLGIKRIPEDLA